MKCSRRTVQRAVDVLAEDRWIEIRQIGENGTVNAHIINDRVAWSGKRDGLRYSLFSAAVIISEAEQPDFEALGQQAPLRRLPSLLRDERQLPSGPGTPPPAQPFIDGMEPHLPATQPPEPDPAMQAEITQLVTGIGNHLQATKTYPHDQAHGNYITN